MKRQKKQKKTKKNKKRQNPQKKNKKLFLSIPAKRDLLEATCPTNPIKKIGNGQPPNRLLGRQSAHHAAIL
jgi:hypothetical protein